MRKSKTNISVADNTGARRTVDLILGDATGYASGDILDANAVEKKINDIIGIAPEDLDTIAEAAEAIVGMQGEIDDIENSVNSIQEKVGNESVAPYKPDATYVDLGLTSGNLWATCNLGASSPEEAGKYYQWGDTQGYTADQVGSDEGKKYFADDFSDYKFGTPDNMSKYNNTDGLTELEAVDDAATAELGAPWKIPSINDWQELINECAWTKKQVNGIDGYEAVGSNGNKIFLPLAGYCLDGHFEDTGVIGLYHTAMVYDIELSHKFAFDDLGNLMPAERVPRFFGCSIRPIATSTPSPSPSTSQSITDVLNKHTEDLNALTNPPAPVPETPKVINPAWLENGFYIVRANGIGFVDEGAIVWIEIDCTHGGIGISWGLLVDENSNIFYWNGGEISSYSLGDINEIVAFVDDVLRQIYDGVYTSFEPMAPGDPVLLCNNTSTIPYFKAIIGEPFQ